MGQDKYIKAGENIDKKQRINQSGSAAFGVPRYAAASENWTAKVTPETAAAQGKRMKREPEFKGTGVPLYGAASEGWTKVTPETAAAHGERMKREPKFTGTGSKINVGSDDKVDLKLSEDLWAVVSSQAGQPGGLMTVTFFDGRTNLPVINPEGVTLEAFQFGMSRGTTRETFYGAWFIQGDMDYKLSKRHGRTYFLDHSATLTVREA